MDLFSLYLIIATIQNALYIFVLVSADLRPDWKNKKNNAQVLDDPQNTNTDFYPSNVRDGSVAITFHMQLHYK